MKKFILKILLFFAISATLDQVCGWGFDLLRNKASGGLTYNNEYLNNHCNEDILVLGSSRAARHYVPSVFEDSLGYSCYNAGTPGCGIIPAYVRYRMVSNRKTPSLVLYEVTPSFDYLKDNSYSTYLGTIRQYTNIKWIRDVYLDFSDNLEGFRLMSNMYRNNSKIVTNIRDILSDPDTLKGYVPLYGVMTRFNTSEKQKREIDSLKYSYMEKLIEESKKDGAVLIFIISPIFNGDKEDYDYMTAFELSEKYNIPLIDNRDCYDIISNRDYFHDRRHLNYEGAIAYSQYVSKQIKEYLQK